MSYQPQTVGEAVIYEIARQNMIRVAHPDPDHSHVFQWVPNAEEQIDAVIRGFPCQHPEAHRYETEGAEWCNACGSLYIEAAGWLSPDGVRY